MIKKTCDKCGANISTNPNCCVVLPSIRVKKLVDYFGGWVEVDLCADCSRRLMEWVYSKEENRGN